jgi:hypothetical protein
MLGRYHAPNAWRCFASILIEDHQLLSVLVWVYTLKTNFFGVNQGLIHGSSIRLLALASMRFWVQTPVISTKCKSVNTLLWPLFLCLCLSLPVCLSLTYTLKIQQVLLHQHNATALTNLSMVQPLRSLSSNFDPISPAFCAPATSASF